jgi:hypothetical protein
MSNDLWNDVKPGSMVMSIQSLHMFRNDYIAMFNMMAGQE